MSNPPSFNTKMDQVVSEATDIIQVILNIKNSGVNAPDPHFPKMTNAASLYKNMADLQTAINNLHAELNSISPTSVARL